MRLSFIFHIPTLVSSMHTTSLAFLATFKTPVPFGPPAQPNFRWYDSPNVASTLVASGFSTLLTKVYAGNAAGVSTTDTSSPPDAIMGAMSAAKRRRWHAHHASGGDGNKSAPIGLRDVRLCFGWRRMVRKI